MKKIKKDRWAVIRNMRLLKKEIRKLNDGIHKELEKVERRFKGSTSEKRTS